LRSLGFGSGVFNLVGKQLAVSFFHIVNFSSGISPPEIEISVYPIVPKVFDPFGNNQVFPHLANIIPNSQWQKILNEAIADTQIPEINFVSFANLFPEVAAKSAQPKDNE
jgi:hypothetical protein